MWLSASSFWGKIFTTWQPKKTNPVQVIQRICVKISPKSPDFEDFLFWDHLFRQEVSAGCQNIARFLNFSYSSLTSNKIWLLHLVDDCQCAYITKLKGRGGGNTSDNGTIRSEALHVREMLYWVVVMPGSAPKLSSNIVRVNRVWGMEWHSQIDLEESIEIFRLCNVRIDLIFCM